MGLLAACAAPSEDSTDDAARASGDGASDAGGSAESSSPTADPARERAAALSLEQAAGQLVLLGVPAGTGLPSSLAEHGAGGIFLLQVWRSAEEVRAVVQQAREALAAPDGPSAGIPPLIAVDQEGGQVRMLRDGAARSTASAAQLGATGADAVREAYRGIGEDLTALGIGLDLAPVADVVDPDMGRDNDPVGGLDRGFGTDPAAVSQCVTAAVQGLAASGVAPTLKHFPGLGRVSANTDTSAEGVVDERTGTDDPFLDPFRAGIEAGASVVMLSSAVYPRIDPDSPAMFSPAVVTDLLRGDLGFDALVITDDVGAAKAVQAVPVAERATRLLEAGGDVVLTAEPDLAGEMVGAITEWARRGPENEERMRASAARMLRLKQDLGLLG